MYGLVARLVGGRSCCRCSFGDTCGHCLDLCWFLSHWAEILNAFVECVTIYVIVILWKFYITPRVLPLKTSCQMCYCVFYQLFCPKNVPICIFFLYLFCIFLFLFLCIFFVTTSYHQTFPKKVWQFFLKKIDSKG